MQPSIGLGTGTIQFTSTKHITTKVVTRVLVVDPPDGNYMAWRILMDSNIPTTFTRTLDICIYEYIVGEMPTNENNKVFSIKQQ